MNEALPSPLRILLVEDDENDAFLILHELQRMGSVVESFRVDTPEAMRAALGDAAWHVVLADPALCNFSASDALALLQDLGRDTPLIIVSSALSEEDAATLLKAGARDYFRKGDAWRLAPAIAREIQAATLRAEQRRVREALRLSDQAIGAASVGISIVDMRVPEQPIVFVNPAFERLTGYGTEESIGRNCRFLQGPDTDPAAVAEIRAAIAESHDCTVQLLNYRKDGSTFWNELTLSPVRDESGIVTHYVGIQLDITARKQAQQALLHLALHDAITDLPNRTMLRGRIQQSLDSARYEGRVALLLLDLNRFQEINDTLGHQDGDYLLRRVGERLEHLLDVDHLLARLAGDEFALLLPGADLQAGHATADAIIRTLEEGFHVQGQPIDVSAAMGLALAPEHGTDADTLLRHADIALRMAKERSTVLATYDPRYDPHSPARLALMGELRRGLDNGELFLVYQPQIALVTGQVTGVEALVRWQHPQRGLISPDKFIDLAEQTGLIKPLTYWVIDSALAQCRAWLDAGIALCVAVNLSARSLLDTKLAEQVHTLLERHEVLPALLKLEITESTLVTDPVLALEVLQHLGRLGVGLSIDDFGTGYSSLAYLSRLPVNEIKIDKSFVLGLPTNPNDAVIVRAVIDLGHNLDLHVVAEGVEDQFIFDLLAEHQCDVVQGYHISHPLPAKALTAWLTDLSPRFLSATLARHT
jgi:diguanylate cyclase (GGDEF)-like protein/PAS domain S-box-containing protein